MCERVGVRERGKCGGDKKGVDGRRKPAPLVGESNHRTERRNARSTNAASPSTEGGNLLDERQIRAAQLGAKPGEGGNQITAVIDKPVLMNTSPEDLV